MAAAVLLLLGGGLAAVLIFAGGPVPGTEPIVRELRDRGRIAVIGGEDLLRLTAEGAQLVPVSEVPGLQAALDGNDEEALALVLSEQAVGGLLVDGRQPGDVDGANLEQRLRAYGNLAALRGLTLTPVAALYERRRGLMLTAEHGRVLARAARQIVGGARMPRIRAFPEPLRRTRNVEVLIMLRQGSRARLWRSARGGSIARALVTAGSVARQRWSESEQAMGGPIDERLPRMTVEVYLLEEDGTLQDRSAPFVERVFTPAHGVAFEHRGSWHYLLPEATATRGEGSGVQAFTELFSDAGLPEDSLRREDLRVYRLVARAAGTSPPAVSSAPSPDVLLEDADSSDALAAPGAIPGLPDVLDAL